MVLDDIKDAIFGDRFNKIQLFFIFLFLGAGVTLSYFSFVSKSADVRTQAFSYWVLMMFSLLIYGLYNIIQMRGEKEDYEIPLPSIYSRKIIAGVEIPYWGNVALLTIPFLIGAFLFFSIASTPTMQILEAPTYQFVEITGLSNILLIISSTISEDSFFWVIVYGGILLSPLFILFFHNIGLPKKWALAIALILVFVITPYLWTDFHTGRYPASDIVNRNKIFIFGLVCVVWITAFRNITLPLFLHMFNNLAVNLWKIVKISNPMTYFWFLAVIVLSIAGLSLYLHYKRD